MEKTSFTDHFSLISDERQEGKVKHPLISILFIAVAATIASCDDWEEIAFWAETCLEWLKKFVDLPYGIPSIPTFQRVFRFIDPKQLEKCFAAWAQEVAEGMAGRTVAIDGKALRGSQSAVHIVNAWYSENGLCLGEVRTGAKSNEITAIPELLKLLSIANAVVTIDAAGTQTEIARQIAKENKADYVLALKGNQPSMYKDAALYFTGVDIDKEMDALAEGGPGAEPKKGAADRKIREAAAQIPALIAAVENGSPIPADAPAFLSGGFASTQTVEKGHGRIDRRIYALTSDISWLSRRDEWEGLKSVGIAVNTSTNVKTGAVSREMRFFIASISDIKQFAASVRDHWGVESMHWTLDVTFNEDKSRISKDNEPQNMAVIRKLALNFLKPDKQNDVRRQSYKVKRKRALLDLEYLEKAMTGKFL